MEAGTSRPAAGDVPSRRIDAAMDPETLGLLLDRHAAALELYARQWCDAPEDAVQEAFVRLAGQPAGAVADPKAWLFRAVRNAAINAGIAARRRHRHEAEAGARRAAFAPGPPGGIDPEAAAEALEGLPAAQREVVVARIWGGLSFEQVAALVGGSSSGAHRLYQSGLETLRARLGVPCRATNPDRSTSS
jgi:RNA polymerase sigma-70 factor (ECF subfamily)